MSHLLYDFKVLKGCSLLAGVSFTIERFDFIKVKGYLKTVWYIDDNYLRFEFHNYSLRLHSVKLRGS